MDYIPTYPTTDLYHSALLRALNYEILEIKPIRRGLQFVFINQEDRPIERQLHFYWNKDLKVDARTFVEAIGELKTRIYASRDE